MLECNQPNVDSYITKGHRLVQFKVPDLIYQALYDEAQAQAYQGGLMSLYLRLVGKDFFQTYESYFQMLTKKIPMSIEPLDYQNLPNFGVSDERFCHVMRSICSTSPLRKRSFPNIYLSAAGLIAECLGEQKPEHIMFRNLTLKIIISKLNIN